MDKIYFSIPGFYSQTFLNQKLIKLYQEHKEYFWDNIIIDSIYDSFPCIWNGGRVSLGQINPKDADNIITFFNNANISVRHTFTNQLLLPQDFLDPVGNAILKISANGKNGINIYNEKLKNYIENIYDNKFYYIYSTTKEIKNIEDINKYSENNLMVLDYRINNNFNILQKIKHPENIEILIGEYCSVNCINRSAHSLYISKCQYSDSDDNFICNYYKPTDNFYDLIYQKSYISYDDILTKYLPLGFNKFKISGRSEFEPKLTEKYIMWLIKPEYKDRVRLELLHNCAMHNKAILECFEYLTKK